MTAFRDQDRSELEVFKKHVEIAESLLDAIGEMTQYIFNVSELRRMRGESWRDLWEQLDQARVIVEHLGRPIEAFDSERARAGDPYHVGAGIMPITQSMERATRAAIDALRTAVPEIVIPKPRTNDAHAHPAPFETGAVEPSPPSSSLFSVLPPKLLAWIVSVAVFALLMTASRGCR